MHRERRNDIIAIFFIILVILIRFYPFVLYGSSILSDSWKSYYPWRAEYQPSEIKTIIYDSNLEYFAWFPMVRDMVWHGEFPHWNDKSYCGTPLYANHLVPVFHLPFALALLFPGQHVFSAYSLLMALFGTLFFYWFLRNWRLSPFVGFYGAMTFFLSGWQFYLYPPEVATLIWIPAILLFYDRFIDRGRMLDAALCAFCVGQLLIAGYPVYIAHFFYILAIYFLWRRFHRDFPKAFSTKRWVFGIAVIVIGGVLMSAVQNYPTWQYSKLTWRGLTSEGKMIRTPQEIIEDKNADLMEMYGRATVGTMLYDRVVKKSQVIIPTFLRDQNECRNFIGPIVVYLVMIGQFMAHRKFKVLKILLLIFLLIFFVPILFVPLAKIIPGWSISALLPREIFFFLVFFISALGLDALIKLEKRNWPSLIIGVLGLMLILYTSRLHPVFREITSRDVFRWSVSIDSKVVAIYICVSSVIVFIIALMTNGRKFSQGLGMFLMVVSVMIGLMANFYIFQYFDTRKPVPFTEELREIKGICGDGRIVRYDPWQQRISFRERLDYILPPNLPASFGFCDVQGYDNMLLANLLEYWESVEPDCLIRQRALSHLREFDTVMHNKLLTCGSGAQYIMTRGNPDQSITPIYAILVHSGSINLYRYRKNISPIRMVNEYVVKDNFENTPIWDDRLVVLNEKPALPDGIELEGEMTHAGYSGWVSESSQLDKNILLKRLSSSVVEIKFNAMDDSLLYVADTYHPRFRAKLDGEEVEILQANLAFRAIAVPKGEHTVVMWYDGIEVLASGIVSGITLILVFLIAFIDRKSC